MTGDAGIDLRLCASRGDVEALTTLVLSHGREVISSLACHADRWNTIDRLHCRVWAMTRPELSKANDLSALLAEQVREQLSEHLAVAGHEAIAARDTVRHLLVQTELDELRAPPIRGPDPIEHLNERLASLPESDRSLLDLHYRHELSIAALASERGLSEAEVASRLCAARAALDWKSGSDKPTSDRLMPSLTEDWLAGTIDTPSRELLAASLNQDIGRAARFVRQVRLHLLLTALHVPFAEAQARAIARTASGRGDSGRVTVAHAQPTARPRAPSSDPARTAHSARRQVGKHNGIPMLALVLGGGALVLGVLGALAMAPNRGHTGRSPTVVEAPAAKPLDSPTPLTPEPPRPVAPGPSALRPVQMTPAPLASSSPAPSAAPTPATVTAQPAVTKSSSLTITSVSLINADTDQPIAGFEAMPDEVTLRLSQLPTRRVNLCFNAPGTVKSVSYTLPGCALRSSGIERGRPFALSNDGADYKPWVPPTGSYVLTVTPYADADAKKAGKARIWRIRIEE